MDYNSNNTKKQKVVLNNLFSIPAKKKKVDFKVEVLQTQEVNLPELNEEFAKSFETTIQNLKKSSEEFVTFTTNMNDKNGTLSKLMTNPKYANSVEKTLDNLEKTSNEFEVFAKKLNNDKGILSKLVGDERLAASVDSSLINIEKASKNIIEIEEAAKHNFLLRGYFKKKEKALEKKKNL